jgi:hypothetical protein
VLTAGALTTAAALVVLVVDMIVVRGEVFVLIEAGIDLFGGHLLELRQVDGVGAGLEAVGNEQGVDRQVAG